MLDLIEIILRAMDAGVIPLSFDPPAETYDVSPQTDAVAEEGDDVVVPRPQHAKHPSVSFMRLRWHD